jgi:hypothetical protein
MSRAGLSDSRSQPSHRSVANHLTLPNVRFSTLPLSSLGFPRSLGGPGFAFQSQARRYVRPNRVRHPTDRWFTSGYSRPRLAATPLPSVTGRKAQAWRRLAPLRLSTLSDARLRRQRRLWLYGLRRQRRRFGLPCPRMSYSFRRNPKRRRGRRTSRRPHCKTAALQNGRTAKRPHCKTAALQNGRTSKSRLGSSWPVSGLAADGLWGRRVVGRGRAGPADKWPGRGKGAVGRRHLSAVPTAEAAPPVR